MGYSFVLKHEMLISDRLTQTQGPGSHLPNPAGCLGAVWEGGAVKGPRTVRHRDESTLPLGKLPQTRWRKQARSLMGCTGTWTIPNDTGLSYLPLHGELPISCSELGEINYISL